MVLLKFLNAFSLDLMKEVFSLNYASVFKSTSAKRVKTDTFTAIFSTQKK